MTFTVYALYSPSFNKIYIGQTSDLKKRILEHNSGMSFYTKRYLPWILVYSENYSTRAEAMRREKELKSQKGREFIWSIINGGVRQPTD